MVISIPLEQQKGYIRKKGHGFLKKEILKATPIVYFIVLFPFFMTLAVDQNQAAIKK